MLKSLGCLWDEQSQKGGANGWHIHFLDQQEERLSKAMGPKSVWTDADGKQMNN